MRHLNLKRFGYKGNEVKRMTTTIKKWVLENTTPQFKQHHIAYKCNSGIHKAKCVRRGSTSASTVILLTSNRRSAQFLKKLLPAHKTYISSKKIVSLHLTSIGSLLPNHKYYLNHVQLVQASTSGWVRGTWD